MIEYAGNPATYPATVTLAEDGDNRNATVIENAIEDLADRTAYLKSRVGNQLIAYSEIPNGTPLSGSQTTASKVELSSGSSHFALNVLVNDVIEFSVGPFLCSATDVIASAFIIRISEDHTSSNTPVSEDGITLDTNLISVTKNRIYTATKTGQLFVQVLIQGDGTHATSVASPSSGADVAWACWKQFRPVP